MLAHFSVAADAERDLLSITLSGFFDPDSLRGFNEVRRQTLRRLDCAKNDHVTLVDVRNLMIQSPAIFDSFSAIIADRTTRARRLAFVVGQSAIRIQVRRICARSDIRCFDDVAAAEDWLTTPDIPLALAG